MALGVTESLVFREAQPGDERVLSFGPEPEFVCAYGVCKSDIPVNVQQALAWVMGQRNDPRVIDAAGVLSRMVGARVTEIYE